jgi:8-oxo-dGTP pyrophosphatase MutT (NUDIX family)
VRRTAEADCAAYATLRADARARLLAWDPPDPGQAARRDDFLDVLARHPDAMSRNGPPAHVTAGVIVLEPHLRSVLLTHHRKAEAWFQFGGHLEPGDLTVAAGAAREAREESGLTDLALHPDIVHLDRHALPATFGRCREHLDIRFAAIAPSRAAPTVSSESLDVRWWPVDALPPGSAADLRPLIAAAVAALDPLRAPAGSPRQGTPEDIAPRPDAPTEG